MSQLRDFAYVFLVSEKAEEFGLAVRIMVPVVLILSLSLPYAAPWIQISETQTIAVLIYEVAIATYFAGYRRLLGMLRLVGVFLVLGFALNLVSLFLGSEPSEPVTLVFKALRMAAIVIALTLLFQLLSPGEIRYLLLKMGLRRYSEIFAVAMALLPTTFITFSEAYVVAKLKLGKKNIASLIKPLIIDSIINSRHVAEALYMHGISPAPKPSLFNVKDPAILIPAVLVSLAPLIV